MCWIDALCWRLRQGLYEGRGQAPGDGCQTCLATSCSLCKVCQVQAKRSASGKGKGGKGNKQAKNDLEIESKDGKDYYDGVDITDRSRTLSFKEFKKIRLIFKEHLEPHRSKDQNARVSAVGQQKQFNRNKFGTNQYE